MRRKYGTQALSPSASFSPGWHFTGSYSRPTCWLLEDGSITPLAPFASLRQRLPPIFARTALSLRQFGRVCNLGTPRTLDLNLTAFLPSTTGGMRLSKGRTRRSSGESVDDCFMLYGMNGKKGIDASSQRSA
jgi:hypothetical protein